MGVSLQYGRWSGTVRYELNDWLNQGQIFDDATGPYNNDLILQRLTANFSCRFRSSTMSRGPQVGRALAARSVTRKLVAQGTSQ